MDCVVAQNKVTIRFAVGYIIYHEKPGSERAFHGKTIVEIRTSYQQ